MYQRTSLKSLRQAFAGVSAVFALGIPLSLVTNILMARLLSVSDFGSINFALSLVMVLAIPVSAGLPMLLTKEIAGYSIAKDWASFFGLARLAFVWVIVVSAIVLLVWFFARSFFEESTNVSLALWLIPTMGILAATNGILKGLSLPALAEIPLQIIQPLSLIVLLVLVWMFAPLGAQTTLFVYVIASAITAIASLWLLMRKKPDMVGLEAPNYTDINRWARTYPSFALISAVGVLNAQVGILVLGLLSNDEAIAFLRVAERGSQLVALPLVFMATILGPYFVNALREGGANELREITRNSSRLALVATLILAGILLGFGKPILALTFGPSYSETAYLPMLIIICAQIVSVFLGNGGVLLAMTGHELKTLFGTVLSVALTVVFCVFLAPIWGATGAAIAIALGIIGQKLFVYIAVHRIFGISSGVV